MPRLHAFIIKISKHSAGTRRKVYKYIKHWLIHRNLIAPQILYTLILLLLSIKHVCNSLTGSVLKVSLGVLRQHKMLSKYYNSCKNILFFLSYLS